MRKHRSFLIGIGCGLLFALLCAAYLFQHRSQVGRKVRSFWGVQTHEIEFFSRNIRLKGTLYTPRRWMSGKSPAIAFCHGGTQIGRKLAIYVIAARQLAERGYVVLTFDFRGFGESDDPPRFESASDLDFTQDVSAALSYLAKSNAVDADRLFLVGHSFGAGVVLPASVKDARIRKTVSISPPRNTQRLQYGKDALDPMYPTKRLSADMGIAPPIAPEIFYPHLREYAAEEILRYPNHPPLLLIDGSLETMADRHFLKSVALQLREPKRYVTIQGADHYYGTRRDQNGAAGDLAHDAAPMSAMVSEIDAWLKDDAPLPVVNEAAFFSGSLRLAGTLYLPPTAPQTRLPGIVLCHDATPLGRRLALHELLARALMERGYAVLTFDFRGVGDSQTPMRLENFSDLDFAQDIRAAVSFLSEQSVIDPSRLFAVGHAFGAGVAMQAGLQDERIKRVVSLSPARRNQELFFANDAPFPNQPQEQISAAMRLPELLPKAVLYPHLKDYMPEAILQYQAHPPILFVDGDAEEQADLAFLRELLPRIPEPKGAVTIPGADRYYGTPPDQTYAEGMEIQPEVLNGLIDEMDAWLKRQE